MKNEYKKDWQGNDVLLLDNDERVHTEVTLDMGMICLYKPDGYDSQYIDISIKDWEELRGFIDNQILINKDTPH